MPSNQSVELTDAETKALATLPKGLFGALPHPLRKTLAAAYVFLSTDTTTRYYRAIIISGSEGTERNRCARYLQDDRGYHMRENVNSFMSELDGIVANALGRIYSMVVWQFTDTADHRAVIRTILDFLGVESALITIGQPPPGHREDEYKAYTYKKEWVRYHGFDEFKKSIYRRLDHAQNLNISRYRKSSCKVGSGSHNVVFGAGCNITGDSRICCKTVPAQKRPSPFKYEYCRFSSFTRL